MLYILLSFFFINYQLSSIHYSFFMSNNNKNNNINIKLNLKKNKKYNTGHS